MANLPALTTDTLWAILNDEIDDSVVNQLVWTSLGYCYDQSTQQWTNDGVAPEWRDDYPEPPNFIESRPATVKLTRSIPKPDKHLLKEQLGFKGYKIDALVPRLTRRATMVNWLLSHMKHLS